MLLHGGIVSAWMFELNSSGYRLVIVFGYNALTALVFLCCLSNTVEQWCLSFLFNSWLVLHFHTPYTYTTALRDHLLMCISSSAQGVEHSASATTCILVSRHVNKYCSC